MNIEDSYNKALNTVADVTGITVEEMLSRYGVKLENNIGYNSVYIANMSLADYMKESIEDEHHLAKHVKAIIDDVDDNPENIFRMWIAKMDGNGIPIPWEDIL